MTRIGFHASHEQIGPAELLRNVQQAETAGFTAVMCSDHLEPWSHRQRHAGHAWSWLGAALATTTLPFGVVTVPGYRHNVTVLAQAAATLAEMFPGRFWFAPGSGEYLNEHVTGEDWPTKEDRQQRLGECLTVLRRLHEGERVTHHGAVTVDRARVWEQPEQRPAMFLPALTPETAQRFAPQVDGLITVNQPLANLRRMIDSYRASGGTGRLALQVHLSWAETEDEALAIAHEQWRTNVFSSRTMAGMALPEDYDRKAEREPVSPGQLRGAVNISADPGRHAAWLQEYVELGFEEIHLHHVGRCQQRFIEEFGEKVLPQFG
ncbi:TIGR03885 family FMN-dependent LLM class oxidoreductase [Corynebacterium halotolerans]|uniref:TIGR03885 family FMN-dependent LLM class oxidoreductase n=1 Tax=Corynebacterium halotolerans TaxID=225326 RepID=UPI003CF7D0B0